MKNRYVMVSVLLHALFLLLIINTRFSVRLRPELATKTIMVIPMSPPLVAPAFTSSPERQATEAQATPPPQAALARSAPPPQPQSPRPIVVRPFVLPATPGERGGGPSGERVSQPPPDQTRSVTIPPLQKPEVKPPESMEPDGEPRLMKLVYNPAELSRLLESGKREAAVSNPSDAQVDFMDRLEGFGDGSGGGDPNTATGGSAVFDAGGYDITPWAQRAVYRVKKNWIPPLQARVGGSALVGIYLVIRRDGRIDVMDVRKSSGIGGYDQAALNALKLSMPFAELPADFPNRNLPAYFLFKYN